MLGFAVKQGLEHLDFESSAKICHLITLLYEALSLSWKCMLDNASRQCQILVILLTRLWLLQTHINFPRFLPIFPDFLERLSHLAPIY
jgi:hypothetical protein